jgi:hypothetical protein
MGPAQGGVTMSSLVTRVPGPTLRGELGVLRRRLARHVLSPAMPKFAAKPATAQPSGVESASIQFESADFGATATPSTCGTCKATLAGTYWAVNGAATCERCRTTLAQPLEVGGGLGRLLRAMALGALGGGAGALVYFGVGYVTGYEFSLIAILVGWLAGSGVRRGSGSRGGLAYQALAVVITYVAIASTSIPAIVSGIREEMASREAAVAQNDGAVAEPEDAAAGAAPMVAAASDDEPGSALDVAVAVTFLFALACALPFLGATSNPMGLLIIAIGLHQAWSLNRRTPLEITGPHVLAPAHG